MSHLIWAGVFLLLVAWAFGRRRSLRSWWRTKACPHPLCTNRLPANPLRKSERWEYIFEPEQCEACQGWVIFVKDIPLSRYDRIKKPEAL